MPSSDKLIDCLRLSDDALTLPVGTVENDRCPFAGAAVPLICPDSG